MRQVTRCIKRELISGLTEMLRGMNKSVESQTEHMAKAEVPRDTEETFENDNHRFVPAWRNPHLWYITIIMMACSAFYYLDTIINFMGWPNPQWGIFYTVHDLHRLLFLIPVFYAARVFRLRGAIVIALITMLVFLPRAIFISPYPDALLRPIIFFIGLSIIGVLIALQFDAIDDRKVKEQLIRESREFLVRALDALPYPFYIIDVNDYRIKLMNKAVNKGNLSENLTCYALTHHGEEPCSGPGHVCPLEEVKESKKPIVVEHIHYDTHGNARNVEVHAYPVFDSQGNVKQMVESILDITEKKRLQENLRLYSQLIAKVLEEERARISHELYEEVIQTMAAHVRQLDAMATTSEGLPEKNRTLLEALLQQTQDMIQELRRLGSGLRPPILDHLGLLSAMRSLASDMTERSEIATTLEVLGSERRLPKEAELLFYRVTEEALNNTRRHSNATKAQIAIDYGENKTRVTVIDNGRGFSRPKIMSDLVRDGKLGWTSMQERVTSAGGTLAIESQPGKGTSISVELPT
jgi:signal transduction histidine kinase